MDNRDFEKELSKAVFVADEIFANKEVVGNKIIEHIRSKRRRSIKRIWLASSAIAAAILLLAGCWLSGVDIDTQGDALAVSLPDGSTVHLQEHSRLSYNRIVWLWTRKVAFGGQARFTVAKGSRFVVHTQFGTVAVLGTEFSVSAGMRTLTVECFSGSVEVCTDAGIRILNAGDRVECTPGGMYLIGAEPPLPVYLKYDHIPLRQVLDDIERIYGVTVTPAQACAGIVYDGVMPTGNLTDALDMVLSSCGVDYRISGDRVAVSTYE